MAVFSLLLLTVLTFGAVTTHEFVGFDDYLFISNNPSFNPPTASSILAYALPKNAVGDFYIPVTDFVWGLIAYPAQLNERGADGSLLNPWMFHGASVLVHLLSTLLVFHILRQVLPNSPGRDPCFAAWLGAALFAVHPVQVESVAWASGMKDLLCGLFALCAIGAFLQFRKTGRWAWYASATFSAFLAFGSKPAAAVVPCMAMGIDVLILSHPWKQSLKTLLPWFAGATVLVVVTRIVQPPVWADPAPLALRPLIATDALAFYLGKLLVPAGLTFDYGRTPQVALAHGWPYWNWIFPLAVAGGVVLFRRKSPLIATAALLALLGVLPVLGFVPFISQDYSTVSDHYLYLSMFGIALAAAVVLQKHASYPMRAIGLTAIVLLAFQSVHTAAAWKDDQTLFTHALEQNPNSWIARTGLATRYAKDGDGAAAEREYAEALRINPRYSAAITQYADLLLRKGDISGAERQYQALMDLYKTQRNYDPKLASQYELAIGVLMLKQQHRAAAADSFRESLRLMPDQPKAMQLLKLCEEPPATTTRALAH